MLGEFKLFSWKSKRAQAEEDERYEEWAFPHGAAQRERLEERLAELLPDFGKPERLIIFLTCKELFESIYKRTKNEDEAVFELVVNVKKYKMIISKKTMPLLVAITVADRNYDLESGYEPAEDIVRRGKRYALLREDE